MTIQRNINALLHSGEESSTSSLRSPAVGVIRWWAPPGSLIRPGFALAELDILEERVALIAPQGAMGVLETSVELDTPIGYGDEIARLQPVEGLSTPPEDAATHGSSAGAMVFPAPMAGRYYGRPSPQESAFVSVGAIVRTGQTLALLEVMKTFHRVVYGGPTWPPEARVVAIRAQDDDDVAAGDPLIELALPDESTP